MALIEYYRFGKIVINGKEYTRDLLLLGERVRPGWWRKMGHRLAMEDLAEVVDYGSCRLLVIGTGAFGMLKVPKELVMALQDMGIETIKARTAKAVDELNRRAGDPAVCGALHLTC